MIHVSYDILNHIFYIDSAVHWLVTALITSSVVDDSNHIPSCDAAFSDDDILTEKLN